MNFAAKFAPFKARMRDEGLPEVAVQTFAHYYRQLIEGGTGLIPESEIEPVRDLPDAESLGERYRSAGEEALSRAVVIKLNGGLGTSMGMRKAKSLLPLKDGLSFLDIIARQALHMGVRLLLMNSFATQEDSLAALQAYPELQTPGADLDFLQNKFPKVLQEDLTPAAHPTQPEHDWNPPGHGDLYTALASSGTLERLLEDGLEYAFVSNGDNLGAVLDPALLGYIVRGGLPFMMEVADRTPADRKGGHLALHKGGGLLLRESAQCPSQDEEAFQDIRKHAYFNTNNLWIHLPSLQSLLDERDQVLGLPLIRNRKTLDPRDPESSPVYQLETAMGSAISVFEGAAAVRVARSRFAPVKTTADLLAVRSDAYRLTEDFRVVPAVERIPDIRLDDRFYKLIDQFEARFPAGPPSLADCTRLSIEGDIAFGRGVYLHGDVSIHNPASTQLVISDGLVLQGD